MRITRTTGGLLSHRAQWGPVIFLPMPLTSRDLREGSGRSQASCHKQVEASPGQASLKPGSQRAPRPRLWSPPTGVWLGLLSGSCLLLQDLGPVGGVGRERASPSLSRRQQVKSTVSQHTGSLWGQCLWPLNSGFLSGPPHSHTSWPPSHPCAARSSHL